MSDEHKPKRTRWERWKDTYRLVVMNDETFQEVGSYRLSLLNVYTALSTLVVLVAIGVWLLIAYTPVKRLLPGYSSGSNADLVQLYHDLDSLEQLTEAQAEYNESFRRMLVGEVEYAPEKPPKTQAAQDTAAQKPGINTEAEEQLRQDVELDNLRETTGGARKSSASVNISPNDMPLEQLYFTAPISGSISAAFDKEKNHFGVDVVAPKNTPVKAVMGGWVISSDWTLETGNTIAIQHSNNIVSFYKHNSILLKKAGSYVRAGEAIAIIGNTGELTDGPHLHFELWHRGKAVNPVDFVNFK